MDVWSASLAFGPGRTALALAFVASGVALGTVSGLTPGLHANNFALLLAAVAPSVPGPRRYVGAAMLAAGVVHTFLDVVPALALGVPDPAMAASALPGHRLVLRGRGREALRLSALGSALAVAFAVPLALPVTAAMERAYPVVSDHLSLVLGSVAVLLVVTERTTWAQVGATLALAGSGALGILALDLPAEGVLPAGEMLAPLFAGLFGAPVLVEAVGGEGVPPQADGTVTTSRRFVASVALVGTLAGAVVGYLPGISSAIAATGALVVLPARGPRAFLVATSGVNTANTIFALFALVALGNPRTGVLVALEDAGVPVVLPLLLASVAIAAAAGFALVLAVGDRYLAAVGSADNTRLSVGVLGVLALLSVAIAGALGLVVFTVSTLVGLVPGRYGAKRANLMGVLLVPLALGI
ncbi:MULTISPECIES: tripartite tricarboxylate transporter permease [Salinibaculum]|uniref:tripartite tricarboxylate transporter permease n=1 Tax=Salinibaculum TaxID=2732368 RepID=UPI0030CC2AA5